MTEQSGRAVIIAPAARNDLTEIAAYVALYDQGRADRLINELEQKCRELGARPLTWPALRNSPAAGLRRRLHAGYLIFYRIEQDKVQVVRVIHNARDYPALLFPD